MIILSVLHKETATAISQQSHTHKKFGNLRVAGWSQIPCVQNILGVELGFTRVYNIFLFLLQNITLEPPQRINPLVMNGLSHLYHLDESIFIFRDIRSIFSFEIHVSKQNSPR